MRLALLGAFPFPSPQGSQVYVRGQACALRELDADPVVITYAASATSPGGTQGFEHVTTPRWLSPAAARSGPSAWKPVADAALAATYLAEYRRRPFDAVLAHNGEAAVAAILTRPMCRVPVVYVAHTVLAQELSSYGPPALATGLDRVGAGIDRWICRRADGIVALSQDARTLLAEAARAEIAVVPPGLDPSPAPSPERQREVCARAGVEAGRFALYTGNLDAYQDLDLLDAAAALCRAGGVPIVVATHDARDGAARHPHLAVVVFDSFEDVRTLAFAAEMLVLTRRRRGGFPIKLLNYMETGRPIVAFERVAPGLEHGSSAWLLGSAAGPEELAAAILALRAQPERAVELGRTAALHLRANHAWPELAARTLAFVERIAAK
jgi:glycosyltransferase involved in cell wall biosynthesis